MVTSNIFLLIWGMVFSFISFPNPEKSAEEENIKAFLNQQTICFFQKDRACWQSTWIQSEDAFRIVSNPSSNVEFMNGWDEIEKKSELSFDSKAKIELVDQEQSDYKMKIYSDNAWVTFTQEVTYKINGNKTKSKTKEVWLLEKENNQWKRIGAVVAFK